MGGIISQDFTVYEWQKEPFVKNFGDKWNDLEGGDILLVKNGQKKVYPILGTSPSNIFGPTLVVQKEPGWALLGSNRKGLTMNYLQSKNISLVQKGSFEYRKYRQKFQDGG
ncbi:MAG: hypothetical protein ABEI53_02545 [Candidatus Magasanikbacteria bacterium]